MSAPVQVELGRRLQLGAERATRFFDCRRVDRPVFACTRVVPAFFFATAVSIYLRIDRRTWPVWIVENVDQVAAFSFQLDRFKLQLWQSLKIGCFVQDIDLEFNASLDPLGYSGVRRLRKVLADPVRQRTNRLAGVNSAVFERDPVDDARPNLCGRRHATGLHRQHESRTGRRDGYWCAGRVADVSLTAVQIQFQEDCQILCRLETPRTCLKPNPRVFTQALTAHAVLPADTWLSAHVGNSIGRLD